MRNGRDDLAKGALLEGSRGQALTDSLTKEVALLDDTLHKLDSDIGTLQEKIIDAKARQSSPKRHRSARSGGAFTAGYA